MSSGKQARGIVAHIPLRILLLIWHVSSSSGEDGIVAHILEANGLRDVTGTCFEFGAWDGIFASNCRWWLEQVTKL
jgi:hypothetical protein